MNLLKDPWIPVFSEGEIAKIKLKDLLCTNKQYSICLPRDDMELAALQLCISLVQVVLPPKDKQDSIDRIAKPIDVSEYQRAIVKYEDAFVLNHPQYPFMQTLGVEGNPTPIQKLFLGLPEGNNACWFNKPAEVAQICFSCAAIALFNQASCAPSFGGGFKFPLRGGTPITSLVYDSSNDLRKIVWKNVLSSEFISSDLLQGANLDNDPVWIKTLKRGSTYHTHTIGLLKGLFWQPAHVRLCWDQKEGTCDLCGVEDRLLSTHFLKEKFSFTLEGPPWPHPHNARFINRKNKWEILSFNNNSPLWTRVNELIGSQKDLEIAPCVKYYRQLVRKDAPLHLSIGGYLAKKASILERHHEVVSFASGWGDHIVNLLARVDLALQIIEIFGNKLYGLGKALYGDANKTAINGLKIKAVNLFFARTEGLMHSILKQGSWDAEEELQKKLFKDLCHQCWVIFDEITQPYERSPELLEKMMVTKRNLASEFKKIKGGLS